MHSFSHTIRCTQVFDASRLLLKLCNTARRAAAAAYAPPAPCAMRRRRAAAAAPPRAARAPRAGAAAAAAIIVTPKIAMGALPPDAVAHFETFGFVVVRQCFRPTEVAEIRAAAESRWMMQGAPGWGPVAAGGQLGQQRNKFVEDTPPLAALVGDARVASPAAQLLGDDYVWAGSEGNRSAITTFGWCAIFFLRDPHPSSTIEPESDHGRALPQACRPQILGAACAALA
jgi:hypothetical protein